MVTQTARWCDSGDCHEDAQVKTTITYTSGAIEQLRHCYTHAEAFTSAAARNGYVVRWEI
jgi:hypothetical protein